MRKAITPVYQPIVDIVTGGVIHYEALARVKNRGVGHGCLIEMGEAAGFIDLIDIAMLEQVVDVLRGNLGAVVAVNVSGETIERSCNDFLAAVFKNMDVMRRMVFEITETSEIRDLRMLNRFLIAVRLLDARVALDDYGAGFFCGPDYVEQIKPEFLKLDGGVVQYAVETGDTSHIRTIRDLVLGYGGSLIAERVDSKEKVDVMRSAGIRYLQGFYVGGLIPEVPEREVDVVPMKRAWEPVVVHAGAGG